MRTSAARRFRRLPLIGITAAAAVLAIGAVTAVSRQPVQVKRSLDKEAKGPQADKADPNYVTVKVAGQQVQVDSQTGKIKPLTPEEAKKLAQGIKGLANQSTDGLTPIYQLDGSVSINLQDRFQNVAIAKKNPDDTVSQSCVDNPQSAAEFFEIDPQLFENQTKTASAAQSTRVSTKQASRATGKGEHQ